MKTKAAVPFLAAVIGLLSIASAHADQRVNVNCSSHDDRYERCYVGGDIRDVRLYRQNSNSACIEGRSWGYDRDSIWVDRGCRGEFEVRLSNGGGHGGGHGGGRPRYATLGPVSIGSQGQSYYCPNQYQGLPFSYADIQNYNGAQQSYNGCYIQNKSASCNITCYYQY